jgi:hypothetical protein
LVIRLRDPNEPDGLSRLINRQIDAALETERAGEVPRDYLGASVLGDPCARRLAYQYTGIEHDRVAGRNLRIFAAGHAFEALMSRWIRLAGFDLQDVNPNTGRQFEFSVGGHRVRGHADGIIAGGPDIGAAYPLLWEAKALNSAAWTDLTRRGLRQAKPGYFAQIQIYLSQLELQACLLTALNKDSCCLYNELIALEADIGQRLVDRGIRIAELADRGTVPGRVADPSQCRGCAWISPCNMERTDA